MSSNFSGIIPKYVRYLNEKNQVVDPSGKVLINPGTGKPVVVEDLNANGNVDVGYRTLIRGDRLEHDFTVEMLAMNTNRSRPIVGQIDTVGLGEEEISILSRVGTFQLSELRFSDQYVSTALVDKIELIALDVPRHIDAVQLVESKDPYVGKIIKFGTKSCTLYVWSSSSDDLDVSSSLHGSAYRPHLNWDDLVLTRGGADHFAWALLETLDHTDDSLESVFRLTRTFVPRYSNETWLLAPAVSVGRLESKKSSFDTDLLGQEYIVVDGETFILNGKSTQWTS